MPTLYDAQFRHARHFLEVLNNLARQYKNNPKEAQGIFIKLEQKWGQIQHGQKWAAENSYVDYKAGVICAFFPMVSSNLLVARVHPNEEINWLEAAINAVQSLRSLNLVNMGNMLGEVTPITSDESLRELNKQEVLLLTNLGHANKRLGNYTLALEKYKQAQNLAEKWGDKNSKLLLLNNQGVIYKILGNHKKAIYYYEKVLSACKNDNEELKGNTLMNLGIAYFHLGNYIKALDFYRKAELVFEQVGDAEDLAKLQANRARVYEALNEKELALQDFTDSLKAGRQLGNKQLELNNLLNLGMRCFEGKQIEECITYFEDAIPLARDIGNLITVGQASIFLCIAWGILDCKPKALDYGKAAFLILIEDKSHFSYEPLESLDQWVSTQLSISEQIAWWEDILFRSRDIKSRGGEVQSLNKLGLIYKQLEKFEKATEYFLKSRALVSEPINPTILCSISINLGQRDFCLQYLLCGYLEK